MRKLLLVVLSALVLTVVGCSSTSVSSIRQDYACSYTLQVQEDTTTAQVSSDTQPADLNQGLESRNDIRVRQSWEQAVEERNSLVGSVKKGTTLQIPARCGSSPPSSRE